jgi:hypothetical protein
MFTLSGFRIVRALILLTVFKHSPPPGAFLWLAAWSSALPSLLFVHGHVSPPPPPPPPSGGSRGLPHPMPPRSLSLLKRKKCLIMP